MVAATSDVGGSQHSQSQGSERIIVVGAGPVGLFTALKLAQAGVPVLVLEAGDTINEQPRAAGYYAGVVAALLEIGLAGTMAEIGHVEKGLAWMKPPVADGEKGTVYGDLIAHIPFPDASKEHPERGMLILPQSKFVQLLLEKIQENNLIEIHFGAELCGIQNAPDQVIATYKMVKTGEMKSSAGTFLIGADGGKSTTRKLLGIRFPGNTWPERLIATDVKVPNDKLPRFNARFIIHPVHFAAIIPLEEPTEGKESLWRYAIALDPKDPRSDEEVLSDENIHTLYNTVMAGKWPLSYAVQRKALYHTHQRLASTMRRGRCVLAGDAAHLNNPFCAMGLATGLLDADAIAQTIQMLLRENSPLSLLDAYSDERRKVFQLFVDPTSKQNMTRLSNDPELAGEEDWFLREMRDPEPAVVGKFITPYITTWRTDMRQAATERGLSRDH